MKQQTKTKPSETVTKAETAGRHRSENHIRCPWAKRPEEIIYHDEEWGYPILDDTRQFEFLVLESAQAGLSWFTILLRRSGYEACFAGFDAEKVAAFTQSDVERLMKDARIIRNRRKIEAAITNARAFLQVRERYGSFSSFIWNYVDGRQMQNNRANHGDLPPYTPVAEKLAKDMKKMGFSFLGPTVLYSHMQAVGLVNDHLTSCFRHDEVKAEALRLGLL